MNETELATILRQVYDCAKRNETACQIHLFGIEYADELRACGHPLKHIVALSGIQMGYLSEISKGMKLSSYVQLREPKGGEGYPNAVTDGFGEEREQEKGGSGNET